MHTLLIFFFVEYMRVAFMNFSDLSSYVSASFSASRDSFSGCSTPWTFGSNLNICSHTIKGFNILIPETNKTASAVFPLCTQTSPKETTYSKWNQKSISRGIKIVNNSFIHLKTKSKNIKFKKNQNLQLQGQKKTEVRFFCCKATN